LRRVAALDVETTCLEPRRCRIVAAALVPITGGMVDLSAALYAVARTASEKDAALVHGIVAGEAHVEPNTGLAEILDAAAGYLLVTYGGHDARFLAAEAARRGLQRRYCYLDLLSALLSNPRRRAEAASLGHYSLEYALREVAGFEPPPRRLHDPLEDAVYTAILYLAMARRGASLSRRCVDAGPRRGGLPGLLARLLRRAHPGGTLFASPGGRTLLGR